MLPAQCSPTGREPKVELAHGHREPSLLWIIFAPRKPWESSLALCRENPCKIRTQIILLTLLGCLCFKPKGMGGTGSVFPFLPVFYFWVRVCLFKYIPSTVCICALLLKQLEVLAPFSSSWGCLSLYLRRPSCGFGVQPCCKSV